MRVIKTTIKKYLVKLLGLAICISPLASLASDIIPVPDNVPIKILKTGEILSVSMEKMLTQYVILQNAPKYNRCDIKTNHPLLFSYDTDISNYVFRVYVDADMYYAFEGSVSFGYPDKKYHFNQVKFVDTESCSQKNFGANGSNIESIRISFCLTATCPFFPDIASLRSIEWNLKSKTIKYYKVREDSFELELIGEGSL